MRIFLTPHRPSTSLQVLSPIITLEIFPSPSTSPPPDKMPRVPKTRITRKTPITPITPRTRNRTKNSWNNFFSEQCEKAKACGVLYTVHDASKAWKKLTKDQQANYRVRRRGNPGLPQVTEPLDYENLDESTVGLNTATPIEDEEQLSASPLFTEPESGDGSLASDESLAASPSVLDQAPSADSSVVFELPLSGPSSIIVRSPSTPFPSPLAGPSSTPLYAPTARYPVPGFLLPGNTGISHLEGDAYDCYADLPRSPMFPPYEGNWSDIFSEDAFSAADSAGFSESTPPTAVPVTPTTGHHSLGLITPWYTSGYNDQEFFAELNHLFGFNGVEATIPEHPTWNFEYYNQQSLVPQTPVLPIVAPAPAPIYFDVPGVGGQFNQMAVFSGNANSWNNPSQVIQSNQPQVPPPSAIQQDEAGRFSFHCPSVGRRCQRHGTER